MSQIRNIESFDALASTRHTTHLPRGRYSFLKLTFRGTSDTGDDLQLADIGRISIVRRGRQIQREEADFYHYYAAMKRGFPTLTQATAGANRVDVYIPFAFPGIPNTLDVRSIESVDLIFEFPAGLDTAMVDCTCDVVGVLEPSVPEIYELHVSEQDVTMSGSGQARETLVNPNLGAVYFQDPSAVVDAITLEVDGEVKVDRIDDQHILELTELLNQMESSAASDYAEVNIATAGFLQEVLNSDVQLTANFTGAGTLEITKFNLRFDESDAAASIAAAQAYLASRSSRDVPRFFEGALT